MNLEPSDAVLRRIAQLVDGRSQEALTRYLAGVVRSGVDPDALQECVRLAIESAPADTRSWWQEDVPVPRRRRRLFARRKASA